VLAWEEDFSRQGFIVRVEIKEAKIIPLDPTLALPWRLPWLLTWPILGDTGKRKMRDQDRAWTQP
jgi:hypothetical protein